MPAADAMMASVGRVGRGVAFVGREPQLVWLEDEMRRAAGGDVRMVLLVGHPGVGKSRLAAELLHRLSRDVVVLGARARPLAADVSFGLWIEAFEAHLRGLPAVAVRRACGPLLDELAFLVRSAEAVREARPPDLERKLDLRLTVARFVERLSESAPVVVVFDDVHWGDAASLEALLTLGRTAPSAEVLALLTARPIELARSEHAAAVVVAAEQEGMLQRQSLASLDHREVSDLASAVLERQAPASLVEWLERRSGGNPLFVLSLLDALVESRADLATPHLDRVPDTIQAHVALRMRSLDAESVSALELLAVHGGGLEPLDLARILHEPLDRVAVVLERLAGAGLAREVEQPSRVTYEVTHPLMQDAVYERIGAARRRVLHRQVGRTLLQAGRLQLAAPHFARSADVGDAEAVDILCSAVREAEQRGLHRDALAALRALLDVLPNGDARWLDVLDAMPPEAEWVTAHLAEVDADTALEVMRRIDVLLEGTGERARRGMVQLRMASFLGLGLGRLDAAQRAARLAEELFESAAKPHDALLARNELGYVMAGIEGLESEAAIARQVLVAAEARGDRPVRLQALCSLGSATLQLGRFEEAEAILQLGVEAALGEANRYRVAWLRSLSSLASAFEGRMDEALARSDQALASPWAADAVAYECRTVVAWLCGDLAQVVDAAEEAARRHGGRLGRRQAWAVELAARACLEAGDLERAEHLLHDALRAYGGRPFYIWGPSCDWVSGMLSFTRRRRRQGVDELSAACARYRRIGFVTWEAMALVDLARLGAEVGDASASESASRRLTAVNEVSPSRFLAAMAMVAESWEAVARGGGPEAADLAGRAAEACAGLGLALYQGLAAEAGARSLVHHDPARATELLQQAADMWAACGAVVREQHVLQLLAKLGAKGRKAAGSRGGPMTLTRREREVARLAAHGHTSREIGKELFIGQRTVETHIANACAKLGVSSKRELVARRDELDL